MIDDRKPPLSPTELLLAWGRGEQDAFDRLVPLVYDELRRIAGGHMARERANHTLQASGLVHEAYVRLIELKHMRWQNRAHFFAMAARVMRRILVDNARARRARVENGRLHLDEPTALPDGTELGLVIGDEGDDLTDHERALPYGKRAYSARASSIIGILGSAFSHSVKRSS